MWVAAPSSNNADYVWAVGVNEGSGNVSNANYDNNEIGALPLASKRLWLYLLFINRIREVLETNHVL